MRRSPTRTTWLIGWALAWALTACLPSAPGRAAERTEGAASETPSFLHDVMPVLAKAGCNMGACHGNLNGKGGFQLSLRGQGPWLDHQSLLRQHGGRRVNLLEPDASLLLLKPTLQLAHEGGRRFTRDSLEYGILRSWLAAGAPGPAADAPQLLRLEVSTTEAVLVEPRRELQLRVLAHFSDGSPRDVTRLAVYESSSLDITVDEGGRVVSQQPGEATVTVRYLQQQVPVRLAFIAAREDFVWSQPEPRNYVDRLVYERLRTLRINPSPPADDATFVRRVYLDLLGILPTADESRAFVAERSADKRQQLVDRLLARPELAEHWALIWSDILRNEEKVLDVRGVTVFHDWIRRGIAEGKPLDEFARELLTASGSTYDHPPANYYRANRDPATRGETTARVFLGIRLQCARCHNHPFDRWTQDDYYSWAALFARVDYEIVKNERADKLDNNEFNGEQIVVLKSEGEVTNPRTAAAAVPRVLGEPVGDVLPAAADAERLEPLARWLTSRDNRQFARTQANRIWFHLLGRGLVEPIDDFRVTNPAVNEPLLDALAEDLIQSGYDLRHLLRVIVNSRTYQASAEPNATNAADERNFARAVV
ncbi:MAG: DUF1549 domain-containing protein, partial [Pirellulaceae bacterium]|nr:DUF1549 domain-containing protein [Pirellulaceae bacterium]